MMQIIRREGLHSQRILCIFDAHALELLSCLNEDLQYTNQLELLYCEINLSVMELIAQHSQVYSIIFIVPRLHHQALNALENIIHLTHVSISHASIDDEAVSCLACLPLESLHLINCNVDEAGAIALSKNKSLIHLNLRSNKINYRGALALKANSTIQTLNLVNNALSFSETLQLKKNLLSLQTDLKTFNLLTEDTLVVPSLKALCIFAIQNSMNRKELKRKRNLLPETLMNELQNRRVLSIG